MTRGYRALTASREATHPAEGTTAASLLGLDVSREHSVDVSEGEKAEAHRLFEENLLDLLDRAREAGVPVYLCTVPSNVRGWRPNQSLFAPGTTAEARRAAEAALEDATAALEAGRAAESLTTLEKARRLAPEHAGIEFLRATALDRLGRFEEAAPAYARARDLDASPTRADGEILEAIRRAGGRPGVVLVDVERAFRAAAENGLVGYDLIQDYVHPNRRGHALIALEVWRAILERGEAGPRRAPSEEAFRAAVGGEPDAGSPEEEAKVPALVYNLAVILENQGRIEDAMASYREARGLGASHWVEASASLGRLLLLRERPEEAAVEFQAALSRDPAHVKSLVGLAECLRRAGRREPAAEALLRATRADGGNAYAWNRLGVVLSESGREREAEEAFRRAVSLEPGNAGYATDLAFALLFQNRHREAEAAFRESLARAPHDRRAWNGLAAVRLEAGDLAEAERIFRESLRADPSDRGASAGLREIERRRGR
jgi:Flp pilus assembly protein TadD, contains TPR repeats